jgi:predicted metal-dependent HD superfamily phosphohydrolase
MLKEIFILLAGRYTQNAVLIEELWKEIQSSYRDSKRHYHTLAHLRHLLDELSLYKEKITDWHVILFSVFYHDIIYDVLKNNNEEKSASLAESRMQDLRVPTEKIKNCKKQILATKAHLESSDLDTDFFIDADLSILGQDWAIYYRYIQQVRKEYAVFPDPVFKTGRKKMLKHFLTMDRIFKTSEFFDLYENQARENLRRELHQLG